MYDNFIKLHTLLKALHYTKFQSQEYDALQFAGSPIMGEILFDLIKQQDKLTGKDTIFEINPDTPFGRFIIPSIKSHLKEQDIWETMEDENKLAYVRDLASPYVLDDEIIKSLKEERDNQ